MKSFFILDKSLFTVDTPQGRLTLSKVFFPLLVEMLLLNTMGTINTLMLSQYSDDAVAAVGSASQLLGMILTVYTVVSNGASIVINHNLGAGNKESASDAAFTSIFFCGSLSLIIGTVLSSFAKPLLTMMRLEGDVLEYAITYFSIAMFFSFFQAISSSISSIFRSHGMPKVPVTVSLCKNGFMALCDYIVIFRPFETPLVGVRGIAICYALCECLAMVTMIVLLIKIPLGLELQKKNLSTLKNIGKVLRVGVPSGVSSISYSLSQVVSTAIIAVLGMASISAKIYVSNIVFYVYVFGMTLGISTSLLIGWLVGAGKYEQAYRLNIQNLKITISTNILLSGIIYLLAEPLLGLFTTDPTIIALGKSIMFIDIFVEIGRGFNHVEENCLRGAGDVMFPMIISMTSCWVMSILFSYILGIYLGWGLVGCWIAFAMDEAFRGLLYFLRWRSRKWTTKTIH